MSSDNAPKMDLNGLIPSNSTPHQSTKGNRDVSPSQVSRKEIKVKLPLNDYTTLAKRAAQEGLTMEALVAQAVGKLLQ